MEKWMGEILQDTTSPALAAAVEANMVEEMAVFGRYLPGAELHEEREITWFITGLPNSMFNGVLRTRFTIDSIDAKIEQTLGLFKARQVPMAWPVSQATQPGNLGMYLKAHGLTSIGTSTSMVLDLPAMNADLPTHPDLIIEEVSDPETLKLWRHVSDRGFESSVEDARIYYEAYINMSFGTHLPWHHYIGWLGNEPVATASLLLYAGIAGIYGVATIPQVRRQGIGALMTLAPLRYARSLGYRAAALSPSKLGLGVYRRIGFKEYSQTSFYRWTP
jgi:GNAT superfamily N-acetyltransferase